MKKEVVMRVLFIGDVVGKPGRIMLEKYLPELIDNEKIDCVIANGENAAAGVGINKKIFQEIINIGVDVVTMGNHVWDNKDIFQFIDREPRLVRPLNLPPESPGKGYQIISVGEKKIAVINVLGTIFMNGNLACPFHSVESLLKEIREITPYIFVDFHGEATSEKLAFGWYFDGRVTAVIGTHTHVPTADSRILPRGTALQCDAGMTGPLDGILGMDRDIVIKRLVTGLPERFQVASGDMQLNGVMIDCDDNGKSVDIRRVGIIQPSI